MLYNDKIINYLQSNDVLASRLDNTVSAVGRAAANQIDTIRGGAQRLLYYTSCLTKNYQDVCRQQRSEDIRFLKGIAQIIQIKDVVAQMLDLYFDTLFKHKTHKEIQLIIKLVAGANAHFASNRLTNMGLGPGLAAIIYSGFKIRKEIAALSGRFAGKVVASVGIYGIVQKAADSAHRLKIRYPDYYYALHSKDLEMMFFIIEPVFIRAHALDVKYMSPENISEVIARMA